MKKGTKNNGGRSPFTKGEKLPDHNLVTRECYEHGNWTKKLVSSVSSWDAEFGLRLNFDIAIFNGE